jgi:hypothetical protein
MYNQTLDHFLRANLDSLNILPYELFHVVDTSAEEDLISKVYLDRFNISLDSNEHVLITLSAQEIYNLLINLQRDLKSQIKKQNPV